MEVNRTSDEIGRSFKREIFRPIEVSKVAECFVFSPFFDTKE